MKAIDNVIDNLESFINKQTNKVKQRVRDRAVKNAETALILAGRKLHDLTPEEWEHIVAEEETAVWERYKKGGLISAIGIAFWGIP
jgi:predicted alpha/beta superfamily hydrolase|tara:strand:- start:1231 stop:1488 length:258 start_codon:yes stop_codon:yes gene_type:complete